MPKAQTAKKQLKLDPKKRGQYTRQDPKDPINDFRYVSYTPATVQHHKRISKSFEYLRGILIRWSMFSHEMPDFSQRSVIVKYLEFYHQYTQQDQFDSSFETMSNLEVNYQRISNDQIIYKSFNIFKKAQWPVRFNTKFISKIKMYSVQQIKYILAMILMVAQGKFFSKSVINDHYGYVRPISVRCFPYNRFFTMKIHKEKNAILNVGVEKYPVLSRNNVIKRYQYRCYVQFWDIVNDSIIEAPKKLDETIKRFMESLDEDVAKKDIGEELQIDNSKYFTKTHRYMFIQTLNPYTDVKEVFETEWDQKNKIPFSVFVFKPTYLSSSETASLIFDKEMKRWVSKDYRTNLQQKAFKEYQKKINQEMIKRFVDFQSAKSLVQLLTKIPNFKVNLTEEQKDVIGQNGNVMVIGRSGTGKTTCAILRLFSIQMLFKIRLSLFKKKFQSTIKDTRCSADDIDETLGLHCIFLTASPVLTNQIQRYYKKITDNIKEQLDKKKKRAEAQRKLQRERQKLEMQEIAQQKQNQSVSIDQSQSFQDLNQKTQEGCIQKQKEEGNMQLDGQQEVVPGQLKIQKSKQCVQQEKEMNDELKGIQLKEDVGNVGFNGQEDQQNFDDLKDKMQEKMEKFQSLDDLEQSDYPGFFTVKSYIMMIDGTLKKPFFIRNKNKELIQQDTKAAWHNEQKGVMMIENYYRGQYNDNQSEDEAVMDQIEDQINYSDQEELEHQYMRQIQLRQNKNKQALTRKLQQKKISKLSFEVDFDYFCTYFWPNVQKMYYSQKNITAHLIWTEIYSCIKGSAGAHLYPGQYMPEKVYIQDSSNVFLSKAQKKDIYETFCQYERWKLKAGGYDMMDTVNYVLNYIRFRGYTGPQIHYVMIDQVQDLPHAIIYLLSKTATYGVFYSGDTAQTIAKGVGFRFCDLKNLFNSKLFDSSLKLKAPIVKQLTVNFRSHNNILQLANSIVSTIQILFPKTIDRLKKQRSDLLGPKPIILSENDQQLLFYVLCGDQSYKQERANDSNAMKKPPLEFGCDQVIIVRNQESKNRIPPMLQHALCLTIYEAKGLEFNDVILFNFFTESKCPQKWNILKFLNTMEVEYTKQEYEAMITKHMSQDKSKPKEADQIKQGENEQIEEQMNEKDVDCIIDNSKESFKIKKLISDTKMALKDMNDYAELCSQLKMLYTAITRPRQTLIIFDEQAGNRKSIQRIWEKLGVIQIISKKLLEESINKAEFEETQETKIFRSVISSTSPEQWKKQGLKMYSRGYYQQAKKCFDRSGSKLLYMKAHANQLADNATRKLIEMQAEKNAIANGMFIYRNMSAPQLGKLKKNNKQSEHQAHLDFILAGQIFEELTMFKHAGQCFFSGKNFIKAQECFRKAGMNKQVAQSLQMQNKFLQASQFYEKDDNYLKVIECLDMINEWDSILEKINKYTYKMSQYEKQSLLKKYAALSLESLVYQIQFQNDPDRQRKEKDQRVEVIKQQESDQEDDWDQGKDPQEQAEKIGFKIKADSDSEQKKVEQAAQIKKEQAPINQSVYQSIPNQKSTEVENKMQEKQVEKSQSSQSFEDLNQKQQDSKQIKEQSKPNQSQKADLKSQNQSSFSQLNQIKSQSSFSDLNAMFPKQLQPDIESIRSMADPEDQWIKSALSQIPKNTQSEYSIIDEEENYNPNVRIIKTKGNIFIQDKVMQKIIKIVTIVNENAKQFLKQFKGYQSLISIAKKKSQEDVIQNCPQITQFEDIDPAFINIVLDTLESFKLYKLCLFVCNRYHMPHKAGRYLISIAMKYSTNCISDNSLNPSLLSPSIMRKNELEKGILASIALHAIFENVNSEFLKIKVSQSSTKDEKNSLGSYFIQGLVLQGLLKKSVFMVNYEQSLQLLYNYFDYRTYRQIYRIKCLKVSPDQKEPQEQQFKFAEKIPVKNYQKSMVIFTLESIIHIYSVTNYLSFISNRLIKEADKNSMKRILSKVQIPQYLPFFKALFEGGHQQFVKVFKKNMKNVSKILSEGQNYQIYDLVCSIVFVVSNFENHRKLIYSLSSLECFLQFYQCLKTIKSSLNKLHGPKCLQIIESILSLYKCRFIHPCKSMSFINDTYVFLDRSSILINQLVQKVKKYPKMIAFFFEQDFNLVLVKFYEVLKNLKSRFNIAVQKLLKQKTTVALNKDGFLRETKLARNLEILSDLALEYDIQIISRQNSARKVKAVEQPKQKSKALPSLNYKTHGNEQLAIALDEYSDSSNDDYEKNDQAQGFVYKSNLSKIMLLQYTGNELNTVAQSIVQIFTIISNHKLTYGKILFTSGLNRYYRQYVQKTGGYNLYDAFEFKKFKRLDLYADNILSVVDDLPIKDKHLFIRQILILLMIQFKCLTQGNKFKVEMMSKDLRFFENLKVQSVIQQKENTQQNQETLQQKVERICQQGTKTQSYIIFNFDSLYTCELDAQEIEKLICQYLNLANYQQDTQKLNLMEIVLNYLMNLRPSKSVYEVLRKIINDSYLQWKNGKIFTPVYGHKTFESFIEKRQELLQIKKPGFKFHQIRVNDKGNLEKAIQQSQNDYQSQGAKIQVRRQAAIKICKWWKMIKQRNIDFISKHKRIKTIEKDRLCQTRLIQQLYGAKIKYEYLANNFMTLSSDLRDSLLHFYLKHFINSSLDLHFILMSLNKIQQARSKYIQSRKSDHKRLDGVDLLQLYQQIIDLQKTIDIWRNDDKWLKNCSPNLKKKKLFEVKWMRKNLQQSKIIKKRAGLKKLHKLEQKKFLKRLF